jgi:hypothetical protein
VRPTKEHKLFQRTFTRRLPDPIKLMITADIVEQLKSSQPEYVRLDDQVIGVLGDQLSAHINELRIIDATVCDVKAVTDQLDKIERQAENIISAHSLAKSAHWLSKLRVTLTPPNDPKTESEVARHIALDFVAVKFETVDKMRSSQALTNSVSTARMLAGLIWTDENLLRLLKYVDQVKAEVSQTNDEVLDTIRIAVGRLLIDGKPLVFQPDPIRETRLSPKGEALAGFAKQMVLVYRWMGGKTKVHKDGTAIGAEPPTDFMMFLTAMTASIPDQFRPMRRDSLHSRARTYLQEGTVCPAP